MAVTSAQLRMARAALNWTVRDLAKAAGLHRNTIINIETGRRQGDSATLAKIDKVLTRAGIEFLEENDGGPGVRLSGRLQKTPSILTVSIRQVKAARALLGWSQEDLAAAAGVSVPTVKRLEAGQGVLGGRAETGRKIRTAIEAAGVEFIHEKDGGPGVRLGKRRWRGRS
jgi:transcriptional regulator with XRE-family HTH domain